MNPSRPIGQPDDEDAQHELSEGEDPTDLELVDGEAGEADAQAADAARVEDALVRSLGQKLKAEYDKRRGDRQPIEERWLRAIRQYNAQYDDETQKALTERSYASTVFVPLTRRICNLVEAKWIDLQFPTDSRNFAVEASPDPGLEDAQGILQGADDSAEVVVGDMRATVKAAKAAMIEAQSENGRKAIGMQRKIDDQLQQSRYPSHGRNAIRSAIRLGSGVLKGPMVLGRTKRKWTTAGGVATMTRVEQFDASVVSVDVWNYFPDLSTGDLESMEGHYERHRFNKAQLARLARAPGFSEAAVTRIVMGGMQSSSNEGNEAQAREASGTTGITSQRYDLVEYNGPVDHDVLVSWGVDMPEDPLLVYNAVVWFSAWTGDVCKCVLSLLDDDEAPYSVINWQDDPACVFGYGLPDELSDMQVAANGAFRGLMDNMGLSVGPQIVVNDKVVEPVNGRWAIEPNKLWRMTREAADVKSVFGFYQVTSLASELLAIFNTVRQVADEIGGPAMALQGSDAPSYMQAGATGVAMAFNAASIWMRRAVRAYDDQCTIPMIGRFVDWNMRYSEDDDIKGDMNAVAKGTSALLEAEGYAGRIQVLAKLSAEAGIPLKRIVAQLRKIAVAMRLDPDEVLPDDDEVKQMEANKQPPANPEIERIKIRQAELADNAAQRKHEQDIEQGRMQIRMAEIASREQISMEDAKLRYGVTLKTTAAHLEDRAAQRSQDAQALNAELAHAAVTGHGI